MATPKLTGNDISALREIKNILEHLQYANADNLIIHRTVLSVQKKLRKINNKFN